MAQNKRPVCSRDTPRRLAILPRKIASPAPHPVNPVNPVKIPPAPELARPPPFGMSAIALATAEAFAMEGLHTLRLVPRSLGEGVTQSFYVLRNFRPKFLRSVEKLGPNFLLCVIFADMPSILWNSLGPPPFTST